MRTGLGSDEGNAELPRRATLDQLQRGDQRMREGAREPAGESMMKELWGVRLEPSVISYSSTISARSSGHGFEQAFNLMLVMELGEADF